MQHVMTSQQSPAEGGFATRGDTFLAALQDDICCDIDETMWPDREERLDVHE